MLQCTILLPIRKLPVQLVQTNFSIFQFVTYLIGIYRSISILPSKKPEPSTPRGFFDGRNSRLRVIRPTSSDEVESQQTTSTSAGTDRTPDGRALSLHSHDQQAAAPYY